MMKNKTVRTIVCRAAAATMLCICMPVFALAYDAGIAEAWLEQFALALVQLTPVNDPSATSDPARAGQVLLEYEFGTVLAADEQPSSAEDILEIDVRTQQVTDCRGVRVGMPMEQALAGTAVGPSGTQLYVLGTQEAGWHWAYIGDGQVYGVEYIAYSKNGMQMREYTLTYVLDAGKISAIRMKVMPATRAQMEEGLATAREIASRQFGEMLIASNQASAFDQYDLQVMDGDALGRPVAELIARMGEPQEIQTLPEGRGRILVYDGAAVRLALDEHTGVEVVRGVSATGNQTAGPRRLSVGMSVQEAAELFLCEEDVSSLGGTLYLAGEALGEPPYGELRVSGGTMTLAYACVDGQGKTAILEAGIADGYVAYWHLYFADDMESGV